jgi:D-psicose/D-tagatose/L-ribulose 3-epimerase
MVRLGINTMVWSGGYNGEQLVLLERIQELGYQVVELGVFDFKAVDPTLVLRALEATGLSLTVASALPADLNLVSEDPGVRARTREWIESAVGVTAEMGGTVLAGPLYTPVGDLPGRRRTPDEWERAVEEYQALGDAIRATGVRLAIEPLNRFETYFLNTAADARRLFEQVGCESVGILFDTFHANIEEEDILAALRSLGSWLVHVHLSENNRGVPGDGHVPFGAVAAELAASGYQGCAVVESFAGSIQEVARATAIWRDFAPSPDEFARRSIANLRVMFNAAAEAV